MNNIKLTLEYDGARYYGWQRLGKEESSNTIENKITEVLKKMDGQEVELNCGCRTETGVHAYGQVVNFKSKTALRLWEIKNYLNRYLPRDIAVIEIEEKPERFHAALNVKNITYLYRIAIGDVPSVFDRKYTYYTFKKPDVDKMRQAAACLIGRHDFSGYTTARRNKSNVKEIQAIDIYEKGQELQISLCANGFLHNMARLIIGTLMDIGLGNREESVTEQILSCSGELTSAPADPKGLFLQGIEY